MAATSWLPAALTARAGAPGAEDDARLWRAVGVFRVASLLYAVALFTRVQEAYRYPGGAWAVLAAMAAWTTFLVVGRPRGGRVQAADLAVAVLAVLSTMLVDAPERVSAGAQTLPSIWVASAVLAWAVAGGARSGLLAAAVVAGAGLVPVQGRLSAGTVNNIVLLLLVGSIVGYAVELFRAGRREMAQAVAVEAATAERERLARDIHDSVLQVLTYVQRRGLQLGGEAADLGRLAGEQEARLRSLISTGPGGSGPGGEKDLRAALSALATTATTVTGPAGPVLLPERLVTAIAAAVQEALGNVVRHAGAPASAWVLVEDEGAVVTVTVRDDGVGIAPGRLQEALREGRLGVSSSIVGRLAAVGGEAEIVSVPGQGTEVELRVWRTA